MHRFYGKAYSYKGKIIGVCSLFGAKNLYVIGTLDPKTDAMTLCKPMFTKPEQGQNILDEWAESEGLPQAQKGDEE
ncbi:MAG: hypothetical protein IJP89_02570 [Synergistaceae bacterium]|nr:hypothetical protein [Synergistaceae bacterium]